MSDQIKSNRDVVMRAITSNISVFIYAADNFKNDKDFVIEAMNINFDA